jgi:radical SAM peptide maturase (CXXX-repeat target family)
MQIGSKMTISPDNVDKVYDAIKDMVENTKYTHINLNCVFEKGWTNKHANILYWELHKITDWLIENDLQNKIYLSIFSEHIGKSCIEDKNWCGGTGHMISIDTEGNIFPCQRYSATSVTTKQELYTIGNLKDGVGILPIHKERIKELNSITRTSQSNEECNNCPIGTGCAWCSGYNYEVFGTPNKRATYICCMHKARVLANIYHQLRLGKERVENNVPKEWAIEIIGEKEFDNLSLLLKRKGE